MRAPILTACLAIALFIAAFAGIGNRPVAASTGPLPLDCNRACLEGVVDRYLPAVAAHNPSTLPLSKDLMYTENNQVMEIGDGFWKTSEGRGNYTHIFADPELGQVAYMGTMKEAGELLLMSMRIRLELGRITEVETVYFKPGGGPNNINFMDTYKPEEFWFQQIPPAQRAPRRESIATADAYFSGLQKNDGKGVNGTNTYPFMDDCKRIENGSYTAGAPAAPTMPASGIDANAMEMVGTSVPYHMNSPWPGGLNGN